jgi:hypothetical protein
MLRALALARYSFGRSEVFAGVAADYDLIGTRYVLHDPSGSPVPILEPWRVRPTALIGVATDVLAH